MGSSDAIVLTIRITMVFLLTGSALADSPSSLQSELSSEEFVALTHGNTPALAEGFTGLVEMARKLNWDDQANVISGALDSLWRTNGWNGEADQFALQLARDVSRIPPWDFMQRFELATQRVADRYGLSESDRGKFKGAVLRESTSFFMKNAPIILSHSTEMVQTRLNNQPFTAEQVARWSREGQALMPAMREMVQRISAEVKPLVPPDRRELVERDLESFERRQRHMLNMAARWMNNGWKPEDWGLQNDPVHKAAAASASASAAPAGTKHVAEINPPPQLPAIPTRWIPHEPTTWIAYVHDVCKKYALDAGQISTAESIHAELLLRATDFVETHKDELAAVPPVSRATDAAYEPLLRYFSELQVRLDAIPTSAQRDAKSHK